MLENANSVIPKKYFLAIFIFSLGNILLVNFLVFSGGTPFTPELNEYGDIADLFKGDSQLVFVYRVLKPLVSALASFFSLFLDMKESFLLVNSVFYFLAGFIVFKIIKLLFRDDAQALIGAFLFLTGYPMLNYGIPYISDIGGWFFFILGVYFTLIFLKNPSWRLAALNGLTAGIGGLAKESGTMGGIFFLICLFFLLKKSFKEKMKYFAFFVPAFWIPFGAWQIFSYFKYDYSYFNWYFDNAALSVHYWAEFFRLVAKSTFATFLAGWIFVLVGVLKIKEMTLENKKLLAALVFPSFSFLLWFAASSRLFYVVGLLLSILASWGFIKLWRDSGHKFVYGALFFVVLAGNYFWLIFDDRLRHVLNTILKIHY
ncbi:MAG: glycosyltransferase family 39 protein [Candidatus Portnoybacteria bacterium]|nr:glycosyltransferase family 39 protein [Candidatus Portnoybacteria bacterium]